MRKVKAPGYNVLVKLKKISTTSGIYIPDKVQKSIVDAYVVDVGPDAFKFKDIECSGPWCKVGDCIAIIKYAGNVVDNVEEDENYRMIRDTDVVAVFPEEGIKA